MPTDYDRIARLIRYVDAHRLEQPSLSELAGVAGLSESHFHRLFTRWAGVTPKAFLMYLTSAHAKALLRGSRSVLEAAFEAGLSGPGRLHDLLVSLDAVTPGEFKALGEGLEIRFGRHATPFGPCLIGVTDRGVCHLEFLRGDGDAGRLRAAWPRAALRARPNETRAVAARLFDGGAAGAQPLKALLVGSPFQLKVWEALLRVPAGRTVSYGELARAIGEPNAARAVGSAVGANRLAYLVPCHRVIRETGAFGGYRWGVERKQAMLAWESSRAGIS